MKNMITVVKEKLIATGLVAVTVAVSALGCNVVNAGEAGVVEDDVAMMVATQKIEYLRRQYARATDLIGLDAKEGIHAGRATYHAIFTPDAKISASENGEVVFSAVGPDAWVDVADEALSVFDNTQHLIGTQLVEIKALPDADGNGGEATMTSYLQAWHDDPDRVLDIFIGTYHDKVRFTPGKGWQIYETELEKVSGEVTARQ